MAKERIRIEVFIVNIKERRKPLLVASRLAVNAEKETTS